VQCTCQIGTVRGIGALVYCMRALITSDFDEWVFEDFLKNG
jgi:hypothetical protein